MNTGERSNKTSIIERHAAELLEEGKVRQARPLNEAEKYSCLNREVTRPDLKSLARFSKLY